MPLLLVIQIQAYLVLLCFAFLCSIDNAFFFFLTKQRFVMTLSSKSISVIFPTVFSHFMFLSHVWGILKIIQTNLLLLYLLLWAMISDLWCYYCKNVIICWRFRWWLAFFSNKVFLIKVYTLFFRHDAIAHLIDYGTV